jgi:hypothetical protein
VIRIIDERSKNDLYPVVYMVITQVKLLLPIFISGQRKGTKG